MKVGDKLICKNRLIYKHIHITKNEVYLISDIDENEPYVSVDIEDSGLCFYLNKDTKYLIEDVFYLWDYFYTQEELRLLKLNSL